MNYLKDKIEESYSINNYNLHCSSINAIVIENYQNAPDKKLAIFRTIEDDEFTFTFADVFQRSKALVPFLKEKGLNQKDRVIIMLPTCPEFMFSFYGILLAGGIPVPAAPPLGFRDLLHHVERLGAIIANSEATLIISQESYFSPLREEFKKYNIECEYIDVSNINFEKENDSQYYLPRNEDICFIQYTSGSTGRPKGVPITHKNIISNIEGIAEGLKLNRRDNGVTWLPLYHDMGLIGGMLVPMFYSLRMVFFPPEAFIFNPSVWFKYITEYKATISPGNNFAYSYCVKKIKDEQMEGLDLASWRVAHNGSELISVEVMENFIKKFEKIGFKRSTMLPCYGLAESTLAVTFKGYHEEPKIIFFDKDSIYLKKNAIPIKNENNNSIGIVSVGKCIKGIELKICDSNNHELEENNIGEIHISGSSVMNGYFRSELDLEESFNGKWLKTGDLGFIHNGELFITGRKKELIIIRGKNYSPMDIENAIIKQGITERHVVAFAFHNSETNIECLGIAFEPKEQDGKKIDAIKNEIHKVVLNQFGIRADAVINVPPRAIPKTANGKIKRNSCEELFTKYINDSNVI